jgi:hypothetical protein
MAHFQKYKNTGVNITKSAPFSLLLNEYLQVADVVVYVWYDLGRCLIPIKEKPKGTKFVPRHCVRWKSAVTL